MKGRDVLTLLTEIIEGVGLSVSSANIDVKRPYGALGAAEKIEGFEFRVAMSGKLADVEHIEQNLDTLRNTLRAIGYARGGEDQ